MKLKLNRLALVSLLSCAVINPAAGQVHQVAYEWPEGVGHQRPDTAVAASPSRVVVATNQKLELRDASDGSLMLDTSQNPPIPQSFDVRDSSGGVHPDFPLQPVSSPFADPRAEWDPVNQRLWIMYTELDPPRVHIAVSVDDSPDDFSASQWHYFTGADSFNLASEDILPAAVRCTTADHPTMNIEGDYVHLGLDDVDEGVSPAEFRGAAVAIPISYGGSSMLSGVKTPESQISVLQVSVPGLDDDGVFHYAVQEPHEQFTGAQFFICTSEGPLYEFDPFPLSSARMEYKGVQTHIRLCARYLDAGVWKWVFRDLEIDSDADYFFNPEAVMPATPKLGWTISTVASWFDSGVLARDANNDWRLFCGHYLVTAEEPSPGVYEFGDRTEFRYYVIDPDLSGFPGSWTPSIDVVGRAPTGGITNAETYHGAISVNAQGAAYITFTRSGTQGAAAWPSLVRARLTSNYTAIQYEVAAALAQGPVAWYADSSGNPIDALGMDYADIQADPDGCNFWAVGTIVAEPPDSHEEPVPHTKRAIWLTEIFACNTNAEMNGDGVVDELDLLLYLDHYAKGTPQADIDGDGKVDSLDYLKYSDEYAKR